MSHPTNLLVTGGAGFIGVNFIRYLFEQPDFSGTVVNYDKLTYAANLQGLKEIKAAHGGRRYAFVRADICDEARVTDVLRQNDIDCIVHFAAETHVDRSIAGPRAFIRSNIEGTFSLLEAARNVWRGREDVRFHHISTDEVYGSLGDSGSFYESSRYDPRSPYSASKAASDHLVNAYAHTYGLPVTLSSCSNNYGPYQYPEKLIPLALSKGLRGEPIPIYGRGLNVRDWLYVVDHAAAIWTILKRATPGAHYNIGGDNERRNIDLIRLLCEKLAVQLGEPKERYLSLITFVEDRPGHDLRYAINCDKLKRELGWTCSVDFEQGLEQTIRWYLDNAAWLDSAGAAASRRGGADAQLPELGA